MPYKNAKQDGPCFIQFIKKKKQINPLAGGRAQSLGSLLWPGQG